MGLLTFKVTQKSLFLAPIKST